MKKILLIIGFIVVMTTVYSQNVDIQTAEKIAKNFYLYAENKSADENLNVISAETYINSANKPVCYIINFNKGWVIVSADKSFYPIIGFSDENNLSNENMPPAMRWWLDGVTDETEKPDANDTKSKNYIRKAWENYLSGNFSPASKQSKDVAPLLTSKWDQGLYYNYKCPPHPQGPGGKCYAGCVATAMAQIMYYYKYPENGKGTHTYYHAHYGFLSADFENTSYNWSAMTNMINNNSKEAISTLIYHCGISVDMNYSGTGSGASSEKVVDALKSHFRFAPRAKYIEKRDYENDEWTQILIDNLEMLQPIYYSGTDYSVGGHAFVIDGVKDSSLFHVNWGWSGSGNGYFYLSNLNSGNGVFSQQQAAVVDAVPYFYPYCIGKKIFTEPSRTFTDGSNYSYYWNDTDCEWLIAPSNCEKIELFFTAFSTEQGNDVLKIYDGEDALAPLIGEYSGNTIPPQITSSGNKLYLRFTTNSSIQGLGWTANYKAITTGINENNYSQPLKIYPNPANSYVEILLPENSNYVDYALLNIDGKIIRNATLSQNSSMLKLDVSDLNPGFYFIRITSTDNTFTSKIIIER